MPSTDNTPANAAPTAAVIEVVTFRLPAGQDEAGFLAAARATAPLIAAAPGFIARSLSQGADGQWTDHIRWASLADAQAAAEAIMAHPAALPFLQAIDPASIAMRHEVLHWQMP